MALFASNKPTKAQNKAVIQKAKTQTVSKAVKSAGGISGAIQQMVAHAETKLGKYKDDYIVIRELQDLKDYIHACNVNGIAAIDTETTGLNVFIVETAGICLYTEGQKPAYIPINHKSYVTNVLSKNQLTVEEVREAFKFAIPKWIMHNADYDIRVLRHSMGIQLSCWWDTLVAAKLLNENEISFSLKDLHLKYCESKDSEALSFNTLFNGVTFDLIPISTAYLYAAGDPLKTYELYKKQELQFKSKDKLYNVFRNIEIPIIEVVADMEDLGMAFDNDKAQELSIKYHKLQREAQQKAEKAISMYQVEIENYLMRNPNAKLSNPINLGSPTQLAILFYDILGLTSPDKKSPRGTGVDILESFAKGQEKDICLAILELRKVEKLLGTYIDKMPELALRDGRIHCRFNQNGTKTGRFSSNEPNMQNIPSHNKEIRQMFKATEGYQLISADYSKQEVFIAASVSQDKDFIQSCKNALINNTDIYSEIAAMIYNLPYDDCVEFRKDGTKNAKGKELRSNAKNIVLAILYSKEVPSIAQDLGITKQKAQQIYDGVLKAFPRLKEFMALSQGNARKFGYVETAWGRRRHLPDMQLEEFEFKLETGTPMDFDPLSFDTSAITTEVPKNVKEQFIKKLKKAYGFKAKAEIKAEAKARGISIKDNGGFIAQATRQCVNSRIQGSAGDITKIAMVLIHKDEQCKKLGLRLLLTIHDELIAEAPVENIKEASERMAELMILAGADTITVPMKVDLEITTNWYGE